MMMIQNRVSLKDKNCFNTGGNAEFYAEPGTLEAVKECLNFALQKKISITLLGLGANVLIADEGIEGLVLRLNNREIKVAHETEDNVYLECGAAAKIEDIITFCLNNNILGLEDFSGIPSSVGGALYINLHYFKLFISDFLDSAYVLNKESGQIQKVSVEWFNYGYNQSILLEKKHIVFSAIFKLKRVSTLEAAFGKGRSTEIIKHRNQRYPVKNTCGSFFRNFKDDEVTLEQNGRKIIFAGFYLDKVGVKGELQVNKAKVSYKHANMIETEEGATSSDIIKLARTMQEMVRNRFGILLHPECELLGFKEYPLILK